MRFLLTRLPGEFTVEGLVKMELAGRSSRCRLLLLSIIVLSLSSGATAHSFGSTRCCVQSRRNEHRKEVGTPYGFIALQDIWLLFGVLMKSPYVSRISYGMPIQALIEGEQCEEILCRPSVVGVFPR